MEKVRKKKDELESEIVRLRDEVNRKEHSSKTRSEIVERLKSRNENVQNEIQKRYAELERIEVGIFFQTIIPKHTHTHQTGKTGCPNIIIIMWLWWNDILKKQH